MMRMKWMAGRIDILKPDGTTAVHSDMTREELVEALSRPDVSASAKMWGGFALVAMDERDRREAR